MPLVLKKEEKLQNTINMLNNNNYTKDEFVKKFEELYPKDWNKIVKNYQKHEQKTKEGKTHPMPKPKQYVVNILNVWLKKMTFNNSRKCQ